MAKKHGTLTLRCSGPRAREEAEEIASMLQQGGPAVIGQIPMVMTQVGVMPSELDGDYEVLISFRERRGDDLAVSVG